MKEARVLCNISDMAHRSELVISLLLAILHSCQMVRAIEDKCPVMKEIIATDKPQNLTSPGSQGYYIRPSSCLWVIRCDMDDCVIEFEIIKFELQGSQSCFRDYVSIRDGPWRYSPKLITWCGTKPTGRKFKTAGNVATVIFQAVTKGGDFPGFAFRYRQTRNGVLPNGEKKFTVVNFILGAIFGAFLIAIFITLLVLVIIRNIKYTRERHLQHIRIYS